MVQEVTPFPGDFRHIVLMKNVFYVKKEEKMKIERIQRVSSASCLARNPDAFLRRMLSATEEGALSSVGATATCPRPQNDQRLHPLFYHHLPLVSVMGTTTFLREKSVSLFMDRGSVRVSKQDSITFVRRRAKKKRKYRERNDKGV